jgi:hypothetical protein
MLAAKNDFDREVAKTPYSKSVADGARSRAMADQALTWGFGAATLASGGIALYLALTGNGDSGQRNRAKYTTLYCGRSCGERSYPSRCVVRG